MNDGVRVLIEEAEAAMEGVTDGPWVILSDDPHGRAFAVLGDLANEFPVPVTRADSAFIAASRSLVPSLVAALREVTAERDELRTRAIAVDEDVRTAFMYLEEVILSLPERWNDPLVPAECADALRVGYDALNALSFLARTPGEDTNDG